MRKRSARKWLHFILDLLPVIFIPVFMVYSHRHTIDNYTVVAEETKLVDFNQRVQSGNFDDLSKWNYDSSLLTVEKVNDELYLLTSVGTDYPRIEQGINFDFIKGHKYYYTFNAYSENLTTILSSTCEGWFPQTITSTNTKYQYIIDCSGAFARISYTFGFYDVGSFYISNFMCIDLTQMFGIGNEPTISQFTTWYSNDYYDFTLSRKEILYTGNTITYDDTDILSQIMYAMYNATDKYFNFNKLFNMQDLYNWLQINFFGGNAPLIIPIVWNIIVYELFMDILFLIYAVFMFIVDFATNMVDSFLSKSSKGGY